MTLWRQVERQTFLFSLKIGHPKRVIRGELSEIGEGTSCVARLTQLALSFRLISHFERAKVQETVDSLWNCRDIV